MFREMKRKNQSLPYSECVELLKNETRGVLSVIGDNGYPYGMPMNHFYNEADGCIYFHCGRSGHREDSLKKDEKVSFCLFDNGVRGDGEWAFKVRSVIVFGKIDFITDEDTVTDITARLCLKFTNDLEYIKQEIDAHAHRTVLLRLVPEHISGKSVIEA